GTYIIKPVWEEASVGLDEDSVVPVRAAGGLQAALVRGAERCGGEVFAEQFIDGREFNLSVLAEAAADGTSAGGPDVLPPAEIDFVDYASGKPKVVGYRAKWDAASFEFHHTPRRFDFPSEDRPLLDELSRIAARCWRVFGLRGYVRVDFRVDAAGRPFVLEVNANPCLAPDAGFYAATQQAGLPFAAVVSRILADAMRGRP
ncbi:MAG: D-alanine--D-alanine ligase, partial [Planctomycetota bacterium]